MRYILKSATPFMLKLVSSNDEPKRLTHDNLLKALIKFTAENKGVDK